MYTCSAGLADGSSLGSIMLRRDVVFLTGILESGFSIGRCLIISRDEQLRQTRSRSSWLKG